MKGFEFEVSEYGSDVSCEVRMWVDFAFFSRFLRVWFCVEVVGGFG